MYGTVARLRLKPGALEEFGRLGAERGNIRAALRWATDDGETAGGLRIATAIWSGVTVM